MQQGRAYAGDGEGFASQASCAQYVGVETLRRAAECEVELRKE